MKSLLKFAYIIGYLSINCSNVFAKAPRCYQFFANSDEKYFNVHFGHDLAPNVVKALADNNISCPGLSTAREIDRLYLTDKAVNLLVGQAHVSDSSLPGAILNPTSGGTVVSSAAADITLEKSDKLFKQLQKVKPVGDVKLLTNMRFSPELFKNLEARATRLTLIGHGTEIFYLDRNTVEVRRVPENYILHMLGDDVSGHPVNNRASTKSSRRLVFLIFWDAF